ncbi:STAS domain-containing protein [Streptomyces californicus]|uniref:STAS domain-containing protein n=1 Tax=Streptomyces californicus TaxID=67351 RepID=UPI0036F75930
MLTSTIVVEDSAVITPHGDIDFEALPALRAAAHALPAEVRKVTWDLSHVNFADTAALHLLDEQCFAARHHARRVFVRGLRPQPSRLLQVATTILPCCNWAEILPSE